MKSFIRKISLILLVAITLFHTAGETAHASQTSSLLPYDSYNYDFWEYVRFTPAPYVPEHTVGGQILTYEGESIGRFVTPQDLSRSPNGDIYVADTGNQRIVVLNSNMTEVKNIITTFDNNGVIDGFNQPYGVCVSEQGRIYIADARNNRVVVLNPDGSLYQIVQNPRSESLDDSYVFVPLKVAVDYADRVYVVAQNMFEGIMVFEANGEFSSFFGTIQVDITLWEKFWRRIATREERSRQQLYIPTEFTGIDVDEKGFIYATNIDSTGEQGVRRMNPKGEDVIKKGQRESLGGDLWIGGFTEYSGPSQFTDVVYRGAGIYSCLDRRRGRIFTYDHEGNILYIFGGIGSQQGNFTMPVAIEVIGDRLVVLDATRAEIMMFAPTEYGILINEAVSLRFDGDERQAVAIWERVLELDENNELANSGIGKAYLTAGDYATAMRYLRLGMNREYYSIAWRRYRNEILTENASIFLTILLVLILALNIFKVMRRRRRRKAGIQEEEGLMNG